MNVQQEKLNPRAYVVGGLAYIPLIGVLFGLAAVVWGLTTRKEGGRKLAWIGAGGIAVTVILYAALFYFGFVRRGGVYDDLRARLAQTTVTSLVQTIEFYKVRHGSYPESLAALQASFKDNPMVFVFDPSHVPLRGEPRHFYYERLDGGHYYLLGLGADGRPFTGDDILPQVKDPAGKIGLVIKRPPRGS